MTEKRNAGSGNATGNRDTMAVSSRRSSRITGRISGLVPGRESALTRSGEPVEKKMTEAPEPEDKLDATTTIVVNGPEDAPFDWHAIDWRRVEDDVRRLRQRIFTASKAGDLARVRNLVAVGTALHRGGSGCPPHRSQRALLTHWAPRSGSGVESHAGPGVHDPGRW
jgi:N-terminal domain of reverse transcriptase